MLFFEVICVLDEGFCGVVVEAYGADDRALSCIVIDRNEDEIVVCIFDVFDS